MSKEPATEINIEEAKKDKLFYFVVNVVPFRSSDNRCLIIKRSEREKAHPNKWAVPGGKLEWGDLDVNNPESMNGIVKDYDSAISELASREVKEECGLDLFGDMYYLMSKAFIRPDGVPVVLIKFASEVLDGDIVLEEGAFTDYAWVNKDEALQYDCIDGVPEEIKKTLELDCVKN
ncbi:hypothetical protein COB52_03435 [Candidatus Kaiserbacteria bacterium]|nr:MAG: hypothetical protein COB52_03435 [Candidatus Kaiserbacteria bacterium]